MTASLRCLRTLVTLYPLLFTLSSCAPKGPKLPSGDGVPFPEFSAAYDQATQGCSNVRAVSAVLSMSGRAGKQRLRGRVDAGVEAPDRIVLEGVAPWGKPYFILAAAGRDSTLLLPRDNRFLRGVPPGEIIRALTGVYIEPAELLMVLAGCGIPADPPKGGRTFDGNWSTIDTGAVTLWLRRIDGRWRVAAALRGPQSVYYDDFASGHAGSVRLRMTMPQQDVADIVLRVSERELNVPLDPAVFKLDIPAGARAISLGELQRAGPLGDR